jgi:hypothetical protein
MRKWWLGVAVVALGLSQASNSRAQLPAGPDRPKMPEPVPCANGSTIPGPLNPIMAPPGPPDELSLPADAPYAFDCNPPRPDSCCYVVTGAMALQRWRPNDLPIAQFNTHNHGVGVGTTTDRNAPVLLDEHDLFVNYMWGPRATVGYTCDDAAVEVTGWVIPDDKVFRSVSGTPGSIFTPFHNAPPGFGGLPSNVFSNASSVTETLKETLYDGEVNFRCWERCVNSPELLFGVRYLDMQEDFNILTQQNTASASYTTKVHNRLLGPQFGIEYECKPLRWVGVGFSAKGAWGVNLLHTEATLGEAFDTQRNAVTWSHLYELVGYLELTALSSERLKFRLGWDAMWFLHVAEAGQQVDFNLHNTAGTRRETGNIFYQGPVIEMQLIF